jgi:K(+)-stimulated pyrophosphate-energized sodium pump
VDPIGWVYVSVCAGSAAVALAAYFAYRVKASPLASERAQVPAGAIRDGATAFLRREYTWAAAFVIVVAVLIVVLLDWGWWGAAAYLLGAGLSVGAGFIGVRAATAANARTTEAARRGGVGRALSVAFSGGAVAGFSVAGLGLVGVGFAYLLFHEWLAVVDAFEVITAVGLGGSTVALVVCIGGGIYAKVADVGADIAGKLEAGLAEDDRRNPAAIADGVGDNVGGVAGFGADLFETYVASLVAPVVYAALVFGASDMGVRAVVFPLAVAAVGIAASILGSFVVRPWGAKLAAALHRGTYTAAVFTLFGVLGLSCWMFGGIEGVEHPLGLFVAVGVGLLAGLAVSRTSEVFTSDRHRPVKQIAKHAGAGLTPVVLTGISDGMRSGAFSVAVVAAGVAGSYWAGSWAIPGSGGFYGVTMAAIGAGSTLAISASVGAFAPVADNASGIAQMSRETPRVRDATDSLAALGGTTVPAARGFAAGSAAITALALFVAWREVVNSAAVTAGQGAVLNTIDILRPETIVGLMVGGGSVFLLAGLNVTAVSGAASRMIDDVRQRFREGPGSRKGRAWAQLANRVDVPAGAVLRGLLLPGVLAVALPLCIGFIDLRALAGFLIGALVTGSLLATSMVNAGGAWSNAKKLVEAGAYGGEGSDAHRAAVIGDTIGDPFKDSAGPALSVVVKLMVMVSLVFASAFVG